MARTPNNPLVTFEHPPVIAKMTLPYDEDDGPNTKRKWYHYIPLFFTVLLILSPHPSILIVLVKHYWKLQHSPIRCLAHMTVLYTLTFIILSSLMVCVARDPGPVGFEEAIAADSRQERRSEEMSFAEALMAPSNDSDFNSPGKWCKTCWAPKPERAHHCRHCGRCILRMDHHCPWIASCVGHRTYTAFVHFLGSITVFAAYVCGMSASSFWWAFSHASEVSETLAINELILIAMGAIFSVVVGSFYLYHVYLITTNQTTLEHISPFLLLRELPPMPPPASGRRLSSPPEEDELNWAQRCLVKSAHGYLRLYDVGWKRNWAAVYGWDSDSRPWGWIWRLLIGGGCRGDGRKFSRNPRADELLQHLANEIMSADKEA